MSSLPVLVVMLFITNTQCQNSTDHDRDSKDVVTERSDAERLNLDHVITEKIVDHNVKSKQDMKHNEGKRISIMIEEGREAEGLVLRMRRERTNRRRQR